MRIAGRACGRVHVALSNSFGFGGNNCVLVFGDASAACSAMSGGTLFIDGVAFWAPTLPGWEAARAAFRGEARRSRRRSSARRRSSSRRPNGGARRTPSRSRSKSRRAAVRAAGRDAATLPSSSPRRTATSPSTTTCARRSRSEPTLISPTKFHNSVHNAAAGYWTIATGCHAAEHRADRLRRSFGAGLLEAASQCQADARPVLLVAYDVEAPGALASVTDSTGLLACAVVLSPRASERTRGRVRLVARRSTTRAAPIRSAAARSLAGNAMAGALPLLEAIATAGPGTDAGPLALPLTRSLALVLVARPGLPPRRGRHHDRRRQREFAASDGPHRRPP